MFPLLALKHRDGFTCNQQAVDRKMAPHIPVRVIPASFAERVNALLAEQPQWEKWVHVRDRFFASGDRMTLQQHADWIKDNYPQELVDDVLRRVRSGL